MIQDPFYKSIWKALDGRLDPGVFEECVTDLLRSTHPTLVPVPGGNDAGMDGAIADRKGEAYPLVCTTRKDVRRNLRESLKSYIKNKQPRRTAVFVTSREITPAKRRGLEDLARELGFKLEQVYDRSALAQRLYQRPDWCKTLLGLTGDPPALSELPISRRPLIGGSLIGRPLTLKWLRQPGGDRILVGQPGSGKTFLLYHLANLGGGLFVNTPDRGSIARGIRARKPKALIVDDAHAKRDLLASLRHLRTEINAKYVIIATCWPGDKDDVKDALGVPDSRATIRELKNLSRDQIVKVINSAGIGGPVEVVRELVNQADGRPGLAVTLADLCRRGELRGVMLGNALSTNVKTTFERLVGPQAITILAAFAVGGESGMDIGSIADVMRMNVPDLRNLVEKLAVGGVLSDRRPTRGSGPVELRLSVHPVSLRCALVRDVFFKNVARWSIDALLQKADIYCAVDTLIGAKQRGGDVPPDQIEALLLRAMPKSVDDRPTRAYRGTWSKSAAHYASLGRRETLWVLDKDPDALSSIADTALDTAPDVVLPRLFQDAIGDKRELHSSIGHPLRVVQDWICGDAPSPSDRIKRRRAVLKCALSWLNSGKDPDVGLRAACLAFTPDILYTEADPGSGNKFQLYHGSIELTEAQALRRLWPKLLNELRRQSPNEWSHILEMIEQISHGGWPPASECSLRELHSLAGIMLADILPLVTDRMGVLSQIKDKSDRLEYNLSVPVDQEFDIIFGDRYTDDWEKHEQIKAEQVKKLANAWASLEPTHVAQKIMKFDLEAKAVRLQSWWLSRLCNDMASRVSRPGEWASAMAAAGAPDDFVYGFLRRSAAMNEPNWVSAATICLNHLAARVAAIAVVLQFGQSPSKIVDRAFEDEKGLLSLFEKFRSNDAIPDSHRIRLLSHQCPDVSSAAALSELRNGGLSSARQSLRSHLRQAIVNNVKGDVILEKEFVQDPQLV